MLLYIKINGIPWVVVRSAEIAAPEVAAALPDLTLVSDAEIEPVVEVMSVRAIVLLLVSCGIGCCTRSKIV